MKTFKLATLLLILLFNINIATQISNGEIVKIPPGKLEFTYQFIKPTETQENAYFFFKIPDSYYLTLTIRDEDQKEEIVEYGGYDEEYSCYKIININSQIYTFIIENKRYSTLTVHFIDGSRELNLDVNEFLSFKFTTNSVKSPLLPLIFNLGLVEEDIKAPYEEDIATDEILCDTYLLEYCIVDEDKCNYKGFNQSFAFEKGKKYKLKYNYYKTSDGYFRFKQFKLTKIFKETELFRPISFEITREMEDSFIIINTKQYNIFYLYVDFNDYIKMFFLTEEEKQNIMEHYEDYRYGDYERYDSKRVIHLEKQQDYILIHISRFIDSYKGFVYTFKTYYEINEYTNYEIDKGEIALLIKPSDYWNEKKYILVSSNKNLKLLKAPFRLGDLTNALILENNQQNELIYIDTTKEKTTLKYYSYYDPKNTDNIQNDFKLYFQSNLTKLSNEYGPDVLFMRVSSHSIDSGLQTLYYFDINEKYYLYNKKFFGNVDFYQYNDELNVFSDISQFMNYHFYYNMEKYKIINNDLLIVSGSQLFSFINSYGALYDLFIQKVNDLEFIQINSKMFPFNNLVRLLNANKTYYLNFTVNHLIKLDNKFLDAEVTFTDGNGRKYILNKEKKIIKDLKGDNIIVKTNKNALLYFYQKMDEKTELGMIEFDKSQKGKNLAIDIKNEKGRSLSLSIVRDFGFKGYYPMLNKKSWDTVKTSSSQNTATIYAENLYDNLKLDLYEDEGEKYFIYIFEITDDDNYPTFNSEAYSLGEPIYEDSLLTPGNPFNFETISPKVNGSIIINEKNKNSLGFQFKMCKSKEIKYILKNSNKHFDYYSIYQITQNLNEDRDLSYTMSSDYILHNSFQSDNEFFFSYYLMSDKNNNYCYGGRISISSVNFILNNYIQVRYSPMSYCLNKYYIIVGIKQENTLELLSDPCYTSQLLIHNSNSSSSSFVIKSIYDESRLDIISTVNISKLNINEDSELIMTIVGQSLTGQIQFSEPFTFKVINKIPIEFKLNENVEFNLKSRNFFKLDYKHESNKPKTLYISFRQKITYFVYLTMGEKTHMLEYEKRGGALFNFTVSKSEEIYLEFYLPNSESYDIDNIFMAFTDGIIIDTIDLTNKKYNGSLNVQAPKKLESNKYIVTKLEEDKYVYFTYKIENLYERYTYPNPFEICDNFDVCKSNITFFKFEKGKEYTIYINYVSQIEREYYYDEILFYYPTYMFFPIFKDTFEDIEEGYYTLSGPKIFNLDSTNKSHLYMYIEDPSKIYISQNVVKANLTNIDTLKIKESNQNGLIQLIEDKNYKNIIIIAIPLNDKIQFAISNIIINEYKEEISIESGKNAMIFYNTNYKTNIQSRNLIEEDYSEEEEEEREREKEREREREDEEHESDIITFNNILTTFLSPIKNMVFLNSALSNEKMDFVCQNYFPFPIYVYKSDKNIILNLKQYESRYTFFAAINNNIFKAYMSIMNQYSNLIPQYQFSSGNLFPLSLRLNTDLNIFYDFVNFYFYETGHNVNIYFKKLYGATDLYECTADSIDKSDLSILTKPITNCKDKQSLLNRMYNFEGTKLITGYLDYNSVFDIYIELNNNDTDIKLQGLTKNSFNNAQKYLKKDIEYNLDFIADHLVKLELTDDEEVTIYDKEGIKATLNSTNLTAKIKGENIKIKANKDAMVYFYGKLNQELKQIKLEPEKGKNIEIKIGRKSMFIIDFSFEGYSPWDLFSMMANLLENDGVVYVENLYEKMKGKLVDGEYLYLYTLANAKAEISYNSTNLIDPKNEYRFNVIKKNEENKALIINNKSKNKIKYQIQYCTSQHPVTMYYQGGEDLNETSIIFNDNNQVIEEKISTSSFKLRFESNEDFVFSYSFIDNYDKKANKNEEWKRERKVMENIYISEVIHKRLKLFKISFTPNYKMSSTKYIIVIAPKNEQYTKENLSNPCFITKLVIEKDKNIKIIDYADIGESDLITVDVDLSDILTNVNEFIVCIISQELRFDKKINYYTPYEYTYTETEVKKIDFNKEQEFSLENKEEYFEIDYEKQSNKTEMLVVNYKFEQKSPAIIDVYGPNNYEESFKVNNEEGYINFLCEKSTSYGIGFKIDETQKLRNLNDNIKGTFKILSSEYPINLDITKDKIEFNELKITGKESPSLKLNIEPKEKDYTKKIEIENIDFNEIHKIVSINNKTLNFAYFTFEKNKNYNVMINFNQKGDNLFTFEKVNIKDFSSNNIKDISSGNIIYDDKDDKFLIIDWGKYENIKINSEENSAKFLLSDLTESQKNNLVKEFQNLNFKRLEDLNINKPKDAKFSVLMIELNQKDTKINFEIINAKEENNGGIPLFIIILIVVICVLILLVILVVVIKSCRKKNSEELSKQTDDIRNEQLLKDL